MPRTYPDTSKWSDAEFRREYGRLYRSAHKERMREYFRNYMRERRLKKKEEALRRTAGSD
jgi:hypothetical protein